MKKKNKIVNGYKSFMFRHNKLNIVVEWTFSIIMNIISAFLFSYGFRAFLSPIGAMHLAPGGESGTNQIIVKIIQLFGGYDSDADILVTLQSVIYLILNIPLFILAWKAISKRFAILSLVNVVSVSLFIKFLPNGLVSVFNIAGDDYLPRALFAGLMTGLSSTLAFKDDSSAGGMDILSYYFSSKKSITIGKLSFFFNSIVVTVFTMLSFANTRDIETFKILLFTGVYLFTSSTVIDALVNHNKKSQVQIITSYENMSAELIANFPHGCTVVDAKGAFSGQDKKIIYMVVSVAEVKPLVELVQSIDEKAFINVIQINQLYGKFFIKPVK